MTASVPDAMRLGSSSSGANPITKMAAGSATSSWSRRQQVRRAQGLRNSAQAIEEIEVRFNRSFKVAGERLHCSLTPSAPQVFEYRHVLGNHCDDLVAMLEMLESRVRCDQRQLTSTYRF